jgi:FixJ family two-component response regulator
MTTKPLIAIVDDDETACEGTIDLLKAMGFMAKGSLSAEDFLRSTHLRDTSCLITDMQMSGMTGLELHDRLVQSGKAIPTILVTAFPNDRDRTRALKAGVICYLAKPFNDGDLLGCVRSALESSQGGDPAGENDD